MLGVHSWAGPEVEIVLWNTFWYEMPLMHLCRRPFKINLAREWTRHRADPCA